MLLKRYENNPILQPREDKWDSGAVFNPSVVKDKKFHMVYRGVPTGFTPVFRKHMGFKNFRSYIGYAISEDGINFERLDEPLISPGPQEYDKFACEDPRIVRFGGKYYIFYTAVDKNPYTRNIRVSVALAITKDFTDVEKIGVIGPPVHSKATCIFPEKINGRIAMLLTVFPDTPRSAIAIAYFDSIDDLIDPPKGYWEKFMKNIKEYLVIKPASDCRRGPELGAPPIKTEKGWLLIYSRTYAGARGKFKAWTVGAAVLDLNNPQKILGITRKAILWPQEAYEIEGLTPYVTFPSGAVVVDDEVFLYYGAADTWICLAKCNLNELLDYIIGKGNAILPGFQEDII